MKKEQHGALSDEQKALVKRLAKLDTEERIIRELGGRTSMYTSAAEFERERDALKRIKGRPRTLRRGTPSSNAASP